MAVLPAAPSARLHCIVTRQQQVLTAWREDTGQRLRLRQLMGTAVQRWSHLAMSRAFEQWKGWALHQASLHRRMRAVMSMMLGRTLQSAFCMMRCVAPVPYSTAVTAGWVDRSITGSLINCQCHRPHAGKCCSLITLTCQ